MFSSFSQPELGELPTRADFNPLDWIQQKEEPKTYALIETAPGHFDFAAPPRRDVLYGLAPLLPEPSLNMSGLAQRAYDEALRLELSRKIGNTITVRRPSKFRPSGSLRYLPPGWQAQNIEVSKCSAGLEDAESHLRIQQELDRLFIAGDQWKV